MLLVVLGFFLPPVAIILMVTPIILPALKAHGFDLIWFGVIMTILMEMGLIHPPVGLNLFVINGIAPDIPLRKIVWGVLPFLALMAIAIVLLCVVPGNRDLAAEPLPRQVTMRAFAAPPRTVADGPGGVKFALDATVRAKPATADVATGQSTDSGRTREG